MPSLAPNTTSFSKGYTEYFNLTKDDPGLDDLVLCDPYIAHLTAAYEEAHRRNENATPEMKSIERDIVQHLKECLYYARYSTAKRILSGKAAPKNGEDKV